MSRRLGIPKGTKDLNLEAITQRNYITEIIREQFERFCFEQMETPAFENTGTLFGNYGEEGDNLIFKILNSGNYLSKVPHNVYKEKNSKVLSRYISEKALRYDLTIPLSRFICMNQHLLTFPFKRFQIQPVWRADRPQKGRFREFYQCDADVIGSTSLLQEVEFLQLYDAVFTNLSLPAQLSLNNRKILYGICETFGVEDMFKAFSVSLDKINKIGKDSVLEELKSKGISGEVCTNILEIVLFEGNNREKIDLLKTKLSSSPRGKEGISELEFIFKTVDQINLQTLDICLDISLARGLQYYTGSIFEVMAKGVEIGSIGGGGRYDNLTETFGSYGRLGGVGISFGLDRIHIVLEQLNLFPKTLLENREVLFLNLGEAENIHTLNIINRFRKNNINAFLFPEKTKMKKQLAYANRRGVRFVAIVGEEELKGNHITIKNMLTGVQTTVSEKDAKKLILNTLG
ncbi:histidine--tRNA ligase [Elysia marginata]|uniref:histidine--tRNA ligase n=1 Tax=Elysia marginata TaxID=1093978 RepID=A0AAV4G6X9_9GAST|nr:histidine--tRNA ligase [Elysia marginata]